MRYLWAAAIFLFCLTANSSPLHIIVDPGHGGTDKGATNDSMKESDIVLKVARRLALLLEKDKRFKVTMTRTADETISLSERTRLAKSVGGNVFLSIHVNSSGAEKAKGPELYFQNQMPPDEESRYLASKENAGGEATKIEGDVANIVEDLRRSYHTQQSFNFVRSIRAVWNKSGANPGIRQGPFHVLYEVPMPSALVELGYISNTKEAEWLNSPETHRALAQILYEGLIQFKEKLDKKKPKS